MASYDNPNTNRQQQQQQNPRNTQNVSKGNPSQTQKGQNFTVDKDKKKGGKGDKGCC